MFKFVRMRRSQARRFVPGVKDCQLRNARAYVSCIRSSASSLDRETPRATRYTWSASASASSSNLTRLRAPSASRRASFEEVSLIPATLAIGTTADPRVFRLSDPGSRVCPLPGEKGEQMEGYDVVTMDDQKVGTVVGESGDFLLVEHGLLRKAKHALPRQ